MRILMVHGLAWCMGCLACLLKRVMGPHRRVCPVCASHRVVEQWWVDAATGLRTQWTGRDSRCLDCERYSSLPSVIPGMAPQVYQLAHPVAIYSRSEPAGGEETAV